MTKILLAGGDSFTWGNELPDFSPSKPSKLTWASLLANRLGYDYRCVAKAASGNHAITRRIIEYCDKFPVDLVTVMWSFPVRHEMRIREDIAERGQEIELVKHEIDNYWLNLVHWQGVDFEEKLPNFGDISSDISFQNKLKDQCEWHKENGIYDIAKHWFNLAGTDYHYQMSLESIIVLQSYLEKRNIPFVFSSATNQIYELINSDRPLAKIIDKNRWINNVGFYDWAKENNYKLSPLQHPDATAHVDWVNKYYADWN